MNFRQVPDAALADLSPEQVAQLIAGSHPMDQIYESEAFGIFNAGLMGRLIVKRPEWFTRQRTSMDKGLAESLIKMCHIDEAHMNAMTEERLNEPVFAVMIDDPDAPVFLIDGHHRIVRKYLRGDKSFEVIIANPEASALIHLIKWNREPKELG